MYVFSPKHELQIVSNKHEGDVEGFHCLSPWTGQNSRWRCFEEGIL